MDDDPSLRFLARQVLDDDAWEVVEADCHRQGHELVVRQRFDVVVSDYYTGNGRTRLDREEGVNILLGCTPAPVVLLTGAYIEPEVRRRLLRSGVSEIIIKRPMLEGLEEALLRVIEEGSQPKECRRV